MGMTLLKIQTEVIVWYSAWQKPKHAPCQDACSVLTVLFLQNILIKGNNNYTKTILQSHTDHYPNTMAMNLKKSTPEELNRSIACYRSKQKKNKSHMLVGKPIRSLSLVP
jgi:TnpA family transposase